MKREEAIHEFASVASFTLFCESVQNKTRYNFDEATKKFLDAVMETAKKRVMVLKPGFNLWRAQLGCRWERVTENIRERRPYECERMKPRNLEATEGRVNAKGIPCLYLATTRDAAIGETRPWVGTTVSVGHFRTTREIRLVSCMTDRTEDRLSIYFVEPEPEKRAEVIWDEINFAFSKPIQNTDSTADYVPTQIIAEMFREAGYDGIAYSSCLGTGTNVALFDLGAADIYSCSLHHVKSVSYRHEKSKLKGGHYVNSANHLRVHDWMQKHADKES